MKNAAGRCLRCGYRTVMCRLGSMADRVRSIGMKALDFDMIHGNTGRIERLTGFFEQHDLRHRYPFLSFCYKKILSQSESFCTGCENVGISSIFQRSRRFLQHAEVMVWCRHWEIGSQASPFCSYPLEAAMKKHHKEDGSCLRKRKRSRRIS